MAQAYYSPISINSAQVPSTQTDFPVLVSVTDARFKTIANSGHVANSSGFDIRPYSDSGLTTAITGYELERYNASTGEVVMWVKVASLSSSTTPIYLGYGDSSLITNGSSGSSTFSNSFVSVYHLKDGTTLSLTDSVGSFNGSNSNSCTAAAGKIDGGVGILSASSQSVLCGDQRTAAMSVMCWVNATSFPNSYNTPFSTGTSGFTQNVRLLVKSTGKLACTVFATAQLSYDGTGSHTLSTATWYHLALTYDSSAGGIGYVNAASDGTFAANGAIKITTNNQAHIGLDCGSASTLFWNGTIDEVQVSSVARSADWVTTSYNNQSAPGTFETLGTEVTIGGGGPTRNSNFLLFF